MIVEAYARPRLLAGGGSSPFAGAGFTKVARWLSTSVSRDVAATVAARGSVGFSRFAIGKVYFVYDAGSHDRDRIHRRRPERHRVEAPRPHAAFPGPARLRP